MQIEARTRRTRDPPSGDQGSHFTREKHMVSRSRVFSPVNLHIPELLHFLTTWWWLVDMMMWLPWLMMAGMLAMTILRNTNFLWSKTIMGYGLSLTPYQSLSPISIISPLYTFISLMAMELSRPALVELASAMLFLEHWWLRRHRPAEYFLPA